MMEQSNAYIRKTSARPLDTSQTGNMKMREDRVSRRASLYCPGSVQPLVDRLHLLKWVVYNFIIGNNDAHAKNLAILFLDGRPVLAPFYDLICTQVYPELSEKMAMRIGGEIAINMFT